MARVGVGVGVGLGVCFIRVHKSVCVVEVVTKKTDDSGFRTGPKILAAEREREGERWSAYYPGVFGGGFWERDTFLLRERERERHGKMGKVISGI